MRLLKTQNHLASSILEHKVALTRKPVSG